jgi:hypothetical protein
LVQVWGAGYRAGITKNKNADGAILLLGVAHVSGRRKIGAKIKMTYRDLLKELQKLNNYQLDCYVALYSDCHDEIFKDGGFEIFNHDDIVDKGHPMINIRD